MKNIVPVNAFTAPVQVYEDGDPVSQASNEPTIQALVNRTENLNTRLSPYETALVPSGNNAASPGIISAALGMKFKSAGNGSDTMDGYRAGTFTPALKASGTNNVTNITQEGHYVRIGKLVYVWGKLISPIGASTGYLYIDGLPYWPRDLAGGDNAFLCSISYSSPVAAFASGYGFPISLYKLGSTPNRIVVDNQEISTGRNGGASVGGCWTPSTTIGIHFSFCFETSDAF